MGSLSYSGYSPFRGIVIAWRKNLGAIHFLHINRQLTFGVLSFPNQPTWLLGVVYSSTFVMEHCQVWVQVQQVLGSGFPMLVGSDFNFVLRLKIKKGVSHSS